MIRHSLPAGSRAAGEPPFWRTGEVIRWQERAPDWRPGRPWSVTPVRVVRDDPAGLVVWLAPGTPRVVPLLPGGGDPRSLPLPELFRSPREATRVRWRGPGVLIHAPSGMPWSVWLFWSEAGEFSGWYVNLEEAHRRDADSTWTCDHELDVWIEPDGVAHLKDEIELAAAVDAGRFTTEEAEVLRSRAVDAQEAYAARHWAFDAEWTTWRPDPEWTVPSL
ncbi:MAG: DUF402 domain-containing protein [Hamadaea sp.]|uniref:DUF402 domain-containing protein n=1 Tax=Hamadaea sp. TaxID=2024425 RepID=UPI0017D6CCDA|nr:DUF402 domain-containing protein [Hamadaea sp.]NUR70087.1 DUF402 domain-containing protein [Hamadaea sp.]NUT23421.1 DUF402 domain-containing protein [Hamadaea sp.]